MKKMFDSESRLNFASVMQDCALEAASESFRDSYTRMSELLRDRRETLVSCRDYARNAASLSLEMAHAFAKGDGNANAIHTAMMTHCLWTTFLLTLQRYESKEQCEWCRGRENVWTVRRMNETLPLCQPCRDASRCVKQLLD